jgi:hypothetical protein
VRDFIPAWLRNFTLQPRIADDTPEIAGWKHAEKFVRPMKKSQ